MARELNSRGEFAETAMARMQPALEAMVRGNPEAYISLWSHADDVSLFGAWGPCKKGWAQVERTLRWVGTRFGGGRMTYESVVGYSVGDLGVTIGCERGETVIDRGARKWMTIRVTHVWRREAGEWKLVHRHGDFAPVDESPAT